MTKRRKRLIAVIAILLILLMLLAATIINYRATRRLALPFITVARDQIGPPEYLYSFSGAAEERLEHPVGVHSDRSRVYVTDSQLGAVLVFTPEGDLVDTFGEDELTTPLYVAENPADGRLYVSDRRNRSVSIFTKDGEYQGEFDPALPDEELPDFETGAIQWAPLALAFSGEGRLYATEILNGHRLMIFDEEGRFVRSVGTAGQAEGSGTDPNLFLFPNGIEVIADDVWIADSNNRRLKVYSAEGELSRMLPTEGLPRGFDALRPFSEEDTATVLAVADTLAHDVTLWDSAGSRILTFGSRGFLEGQFQYPNDVSVDDKNRIFVADSANARIQVWGWPEEVAPVPAVTVPPYWLWCLSPLLLLPLLLLLRRRRFFAMDDFLDVMAEVSLIDQVAHGKGRTYWMVLPATYERFKHLEVQGIKLEHLLHETEHSDADARSIMDRLELDYDTAAILAVATRARVFCTEDSELRRLARALEVDVVGHQEYLERFGKKEQQTAAG